MFDKLMNDFSNIYGLDTELYKFFSPGRVNLIGEHTDYNGGYVFPCAITFGTYGVVRKRADRKLRFYSNNFEKIGILEVNLDNLDYDVNHSWVNYMKGVFKYFMEVTDKIDFGLDILIEGNIPNGAGLSSSASIELLMGEIIRKIYVYDMDTIEMIKLCQRVENVFIGLNSGIMDQFSIGMGKKNNAVLLDCNTLEYRYSKLAMDGYKLVIINTKKRRELAESKYNERRSQCEEALVLLNKEIEKPNKYLCEFTPIEFEELKDKLTDDILLRRARHAVYENARTIEAVKVLESGDIKGFGELMYASHLSLKDDYEVTGIELDTIVDIAKSIDGVVGSRMTGAGFGGCAIAIIKEESVASFEKEMVRRYEDIIGHKPEIYVVDIGDGVKEYL